MYNEFVSEKYHSPYTCLLNCVEASVIFEFSVIYYSGQYNSSQNISTNLGRFGLNILESSITTKLFGYNASILIGHIINYQVFVRDQYLLKLIVDLRISRI
jgi:hypothetical protein